jgi:hypothetical protein
LLTFGGTFDLYTGFLASFISPAIIAEFHEFMAENSRCHELLHEPRQEQRIIGESRELEQVSEAREMILMHIIFTLQNEAIQESVKNMILVMVSAKLFSDDDGQSQFWILTWERVDRFIPDLRVELFRNHSHGTFDFESIRIFEIPFRYLIPFLTLVQSTIESRKRPL